MVQRLAKRAIQSLMGAGLLLLMLPFIAFVLFGLCCAWLWRKLELWAVYDGDTDRRDREEWRRR
jgi:hypothetical protein